MTDFQLSMVFATFFRVRLTGTRFIKTHKIQPQRVIFKNPFK